VLVPFPFALQSSGMLAWVQVGIQETLLPLKDTPNAAIIID